MLKGHLAFRNLLYAAVVNNANEKYPVMLFGTGDFNIIVFL